MAARTTVKLTGSTWLPGSIANATLGLPVAYPTWLTLTWSGAAPPVAGRARRARTPRTAVAAAHSRLTDAIAIPAARVNPVPVLHDPAFPS